MIEYISHQSEGLIAANKVSTKFYTMCCEISFPSFFLSDVLAPCPLYC